MNILMSAPKPDASRRTRVSSDSAWPLRRADGKTWAQAHAERINQGTENHQ